MFTRGVLEGAALRMRSRGNLRRKPLNRLQVEVLESRRLLAVTTTFNAGVLTFIGDGGNDTVIVEPTGATTIDYDDGTTLGSQSQSGVTQIVFNAGGGDDRLIFSNPLSSLFSPAGGIQFSGGSGNDTLVIASGALAGVTGTYTIAGPDSGELRYEQGANTLDLDFSGLELIQDTIEASTLTTQGSAAGETINVIDGPLLTPISSFAQGPVILTGGDWEDTDHFRNCGVPAGNPCAEDTVGQEVEFLRDQSFNGGDGILAIGASPDLDGIEPGLAREAVNIVGAAIGESVTHVHATIPQYNDYVTSNFTPPGSGPSSFEDISSASASPGTRVLFGNDNSLAFNDEFGGVVGNGQFDIGFEFHLYGVPDSTVAIGSDGYITMVRAQDSATDTSPDNGPNDPSPGGPPTWTGGGISGNSMVTTPNGTIAGWWEDLAPSLGSGEVRYATLGTPGNQRFIVQYTNVQHAGGGNPVTFQIKLFEATGTIEIVYDTIATDGGVHQVSLDHPIGIVDTIAFRGNGLPADNGIRFSPTGAVVPEVASTPRLEDVDFSDYEVIYVATAGSQLDDYSGPNALDLGVLAARRDDIRDYVRGGGGLYANTQQATEAEAGNLGWLEIPDLFIVNNLGAASQPLSLTPDGVAIGMPPPIQPNGNLAYHSNFLGPPGLNGLDVLVVDTSNRWITIGQGAINETIGGGDSLEINGTLTTIQAAGKGSLVINGNGGDDSINVGQTGDSLDAFGPMLSVDGGPGINSLSVDDSGDMTGDTVLIDSTAISGLAPFAIDHTSFNSVTVTTTAGDDLIDVDFTAGGPAEVTVFGGAGSDVFGASSDIQPSLTTLQTFFGGDPSIPPAPVTPPGDQLNLDMTIAAEPIIIDTVGGVAQSASHLNVLFGEMEDVDAVDVEDLQVGDLFVEGTPTSDRIIFNQHILGQQLVTINSVRYGPFFPNRYLIVYANTGNDFVATHEPQPLPVDFRGEDGNDYLASGNAADTLLGGGGNDKLLGGEGNNVLDGADGNDIVEGRAGNDLLFGGDGNDSLVARDGNDILFAGAGNDSINGGIGNDLLDAGSGNDVANAYLGSDVVLGGEGNDVLYGDAGIDLVIGESGADRLYGDGSADVLVNGDFNASLRTSIDNDLAALLASFGQSGISGALSAALGSWFGGSNDSAFQGYTSDTDIDELTGGLDADIYWAAMNDVLLNFLPGTDLLM